MNEMELELSRLFNAVIGEPPRQVSVQVVRKRAARRRRFTYVAATAALAVAGSVGVALASTTAVPHRQAGDHQQAGDYQAAATVPAYYFEEIPGNGHNVQPVNTIRSTATGAVAGTVTCPQVPPYPVNEVTAGSTSSSLTFFMACLIPDPAKPHLVAGTKIFQFTVSRTGHISGLTLAAGGNLVRQVPQLLTASPDGSELAFAENVDGNPDVFKIVILNTRTGKQAVWKATAPGGRQFQPTSFSFADRGRELAVFGHYACNQRGCPSGNELIIISPAWKGGTLASGRIVFSGYEDITYPEVAILSPDGKTVMLGGLDNRGGSRVVGISAKTGKLTGEVLTIPQGALRWMSEDPSGKFVLVAGGYGNDAFHGWIDQGKLKTIPGPRELPLIEVW